MLNTQLFKCRDKLCKPNPEKNPPNCIKSPELKAFTASKLSKYGVFPGPYLDTFHAVITTMLKGITATDEMVMLCITSLSCSTYPVFDLFPIDYRYKLSQNGEPIEMHWLDGDQTPNIIEKLETDGIEGNKSDEDNVYVDDSDSKDEFTDAQI